MRGPRRFSPPASGTHGRRGDGDQGVAAPIDTGSLFETTSVPGLLVTRTATWPERTAYRTRSNGSYTDVTWAEHGKDVREIAASLVETGLRSTDRLAIMGDSCPEWVACDQAAQSIGAVPFGVYPTSSAAEVAYLLADSGATTVVVEKQEHLDKVLQVADELPRLRRIIVVDPCSAPASSAVAVTSLGRMKELGRASAQCRPERFTAEVDKVTPDTIATLIYTSGTTGRPKGVVHTQRSLLASSCSYVMVYPELAAREQRSVCHLPLAHVVERALTAVLPLHAPLVPHYGAEPASFLQTLKETNPTFFMSVPRYWEKIAAEVITGVRSGPRSRRWAYGVAMAAGARRLDACRHGHRLSITAKASSWLAHRMVFGPLLEQVGMGEVELALTGAAAIPPAVKDLWQTWGVGLRELYGQTESGGPIAAATEPCSESGDLGFGVPHPRWEMKLAPDGEVLYRSPGVFEGYWNEGGEPVGALADGWLPTGDVGRLDSRGRLRLVDRKKDLLVTSGGKTLSPAQIENALRARPYILEAVIFAEGRKYVTALLEIDEASIREWATTQDLDHMDYADLVRHPRVIDLVSAEVSRANDTLARVEQVKHFRLLPRPLDPAAGDTTPTRKIKRRHLQSVFSELVESMYDEGPDR